MGLGAFAALTTLAVVTLSGCSKPVPAEPTTPAVRATLSAQANNAATLKADSTRNAK
jgi:hypothetical protein